MPILHMAGSGGRDAGGGGRQRGGAHVGLRGLVFCAALVTLVPISVCGDAASPRVANPG